MCWDSVYNPSRLSCCHYICSKVVQESWSLEDQKLISLLRSKKAPPKEENVKKIGRGCAHLRLTVYGNPLWSLLSSQLIFHWKSSQAYIQTSCCCCVLCGGEFLTVQVMLLSFCLLQARVFSTVSIGSIWAMNLSLPVWMSDTSKTLVIS